MRSLIITSWSLFILAGLLTGTTLAQTTNAEPADIQSGSYMKTAFQMGYGQPYGNYQQTCQNIRTRGDRLEARCQKRDGGWRDTSIDYRRCRGQIVNDDGNLRCDNSGRSQRGRGAGWRGGLPEGSYQQTCQNVNMRGNLLQARCAKRDGGWRDTTLDYRNCRGDIINDDGNLRCGTGGGQWQGRGPGGFWGGGMPQGDYQQTCQNVNMNGGMLQARCQKRDGGWRDTSIDYRDCRGGIVNDDGNLRCDNSGRWQSGGPGGGYWQGRMPRGSYEQSCQNMSVNANLLQARCQKKDGGWRDTSIDYRDCRGDIINDDGNLRCR